MQEAKDLREAVIEYIQTADEKTVRMIHAMLEVDAKEDWWDEITESHQQAIDKGIEQLDNGEGIPHDEVMRKYNKWLQ